MSFYGLVLIATLLLISVYVCASLGEISSASGIANAYSVIAARIAGSAGTPPVQLPKGG